MENNWSLTKLENHISIKHGYAFKGRDFKDYETYDCLLTPGNFGVGGGFKSDKFKYYEGIVPEDYILKEDDLVVTMTDLSKESDTLGFSALIPNFKNRRILHNQRTGLVEFKGESIDKTFLYFLMRSKEYRHHVVSTATGTTVKHTSPTRILSFEFRLPPKDIQTKIGNFLLMFEKRANANVELNITLEAISQVLFKSWFVDFDPVIDNALSSGKKIKDFPPALQHKAKLRSSLRNSNEYEPLSDEILALFPKEFVESDIGWIPDGWSFSSIDEVCSHIIDHRGKTPKKLGGDWAEEGVAAISAKNIKNNQIVRPDTIRYVDENLYAKWMKEPLQQKDIIMTSEAPMGEMYFLAEKADYLLSQRLYGMRADKEKTTGEYLNYWLQTSTAKADLEGRATGTTVTGIRQVELKKVAVLLPKLPVAQKFAEIAGQHLLQKERNNNQIESLEETRDYLLPNLISGKVQLEKEV